MHNQNMSTKMTKEAEALKIAISQAQLNLKTATQALHELIRNCVCEFEPLTESELNDEWMSKYSLCLICGTYHGWRCKESPDGICHYFSRDGKVQLLGNREYDLPLNHDKMGESYDTCIFCGSPKERK